MVAKCQFDSLRSLDFTGISAVYAAIGTPLTRPARILKMSNNTEGDMIISDDDTDVAGKIFLAAGSFTLYDIQSNMNPISDDRYVCEVGTQWWCKQITSPVSGKVYIEVVR